MNNARQRHPIVEGGIRVLPRIIPIVTVVGLYAIVGFELAVVAGIGMLIGEVASDD